MVAKPKHITLADDTEIPILYEDRSILAIDKPAGWLLVPTSWENTGRNLQLAIESSLQARDFWAASRNLRFLRFIHRLDADTSGVLLMVKSRGAVPAYSELFETRRVRKLYLAVVRGTVKNADWTCRLPLEPDPGSSRGRMRVAKSGRISHELSSRAETKEAETHFRVVQTGPGGALIAAEPLTGRTHQIRVHLSASDCPVLGDPLYGSADSDGLALRAVAIAYKDPFTEKPMRIQAPVTDFLERYGFRLAPSEVFGEFIRLTQR